MARLRFSDDPMSRLAIWARRFAFFSLVATVLSIIVVRSGFLEIEPSLVTFGGALVFAALAILVGLAAFVTIWKDGLERARPCPARDLRRRAVCSPIRPISAVKAYQAAADRRHHHRSDRSAALRGDRARAPAQRQSRSSMPAFTRPSSSGAPIRISSRCWCPCRPRPPSMPRLRSPTSGAGAWSIPAIRRPRRPEGRIEAVARTPIMGFRDDVVIRVRPAPDGARIDMRSASRYGRHDLGTNAARIRSLAGRHRGDRGAAGGKAGNASRRPRARRLRRPKR